MTQRDITISGLAALTLSGAGLLFASGSQWAWLALGGLSLFVAIVGATSRHWATWIRILVVGVSIVGLTASVLPWFDLATGYARLG